MTMHSHQSQKHVYLRRFGSCVIARGNGPSKAFVLKSSSSVWMPQEEEKDQTLRVAENPECHHPGRTSALTKYRRREVGGQLGDLVAADV